MAPKWRQLHSMNNPAKPNAIRELDRINLRLSPETFEAIDSSRNARPGRLSRNTWIAEAIEEKLLRDAAQTGAQNDDRQRHA
jgi:predicted HicB family RNase H-like nuclease